MLYGREIFNFLVRKDVRKLLKRKDSDAGETGNRLNATSLFVAHSCYYIALLVSSFSFYWRMILDSILLAIDAFLFHIVKLGIIIFNFGMENMYYCESKEMVFFFLIIFLNNY